MFSGFGLQRSEKKTKPANPLFLYPTLYKRPNLLYRGRLRCFTRFSSFDALAKVKGVVFQYFANLLLGILKDLLFRQKRN
jgi:hypothetical protein